jgi:putrescine importer
MGRSNGIPKKFFGALDPKNHIPRNNVILVGAIALAGSFIITYDQGADLLNFGALLAFMGVNVAALVRYYVREEKKQVLNLLSPLLGFLICAFIWTHLSAPALKLGAIWMVLGMTYGAIKTRGFQADLVNFDIPSDES